MQVVFLQRRYNSLMFLRFSVLLLFCLLPVTATHAKDNWLRLQTKNFTLVGNASEKDLRRVGNNLEQFRNVFATLFKQANLAVSEPMTVIVFKNDGSFKPYKPLYQGKPASVSGYFQRTDDGINIALALAENETRQFEIIFHEYVHLILSNNLPGAPLWFNEGLAEYYSTLDFNSKKDSVGVGKHIDNHVFYLRDRGLMPLRTLFAVTHDSPHYNERNKQGVFYAQSWALLHYLLLDKNAARQKQVSKFVDLLRGGMGLEQAVAQAFEMTVEQMEKELRAYVNRNSYPYLSFKLDVKTTDSDTAQVTPLSDAAAHAYLADLTLGLRRNDKAEEETKLALTADPEDPLANAAAARVQARAGEFGAARALIHKAIAADPQNYRWHYYLASFIRADALAKSNGRLREFSATDRPLIEAAIAKSLALNPNFAQGLALSAFVKLINGENLDQGAAQLRRAVLLQPQRTDYYLTLVQIYARQNNFTAARSVLAGLKKRELDAGRQREIDSLAGFVDQLEQYNARRSAVEAGTPPPPPSPDSAPAAATDTGGQTDEELPPGSNEPPLRPLADGEQRIAGTLVKIDCSASGAQLVIKDAAGKLLRFDAGDMSDVSFISYIGDLGGQITCGARTPPNPVVIGYRPSAAGKNGLMGKAVAVEFIPPDFKLPQ